MNRVVVACVGLLALAGGSVADVGCGYGAPTIAIAHMFPGSRVLGIDADDVA